jgi:secreted PhoX family phosphatase
MKRNLLKSALLTLFLGSAFAQTETIVLPRESSWKYLDDGTDQGSAWTSTTFNDAGWSSGNGILGYGDGQATIVGYGPSSTSKYITTYFRKQITLTDLPAANEEFVLRLLRDDGAIVYVNGVEVFRVNLGNGPISYTDLSNTNVNGSSEDTYYEDIIPSSALVLGTNVIAVEIHQDAVTSSDISFDMELVYVEIPPLVPPVQCILGADTTHISRFTSVMPSAQPDSLRIPSTHTFQMLIQSGTPYTDTTLGVTKGLFDFTGYVAKQGSSHNGYLSINHELGSFPSAGVSMLDINFDSTALVWNVTNNVPVDFTDVNGTGRNCSGGVTPWGTIITAEETLPNVDANGDGFQDIGWLVEIDPVTAEVVDNNNDGTADKLWRMGRMSHENVVIAEDLKTAYYGNDQNPGFIFKFVADEEKKMGEGSLYVLKLDGPLDATTSGTWVGIPNYTPTDCNNTTAYASSVGATNFYNVEDVEISPIDGRVYFTSKSSSRVYRFKDEGSTVSGLHVFVGNSATEYVLDTDAGLVSELWGGGMDNLTFDNEGNLYCIQDGGRNHIWMVPACHTQMNPAVKLFAVTPAGCEPTGMTFSPDFRFMFVSMQHPSGSNSTVQIDATGSPVVFNKESAIVIARKEYLGPDALPLTPISTASLEENGPATIATTVYPNPTEGLFTLAIHSSTSTQAVVRVTDLMGTSVRFLTKSLKNGENKMNIDLMHLPAGIYNTSITVDGQTINKRIVKY